MLDLPTSRRLQLVILNVFLEVEFSSYQLIRGISGEFDLDTASQLCNKVCKTFNWRQLSNLTPFGSNSCITSSVCGLVSLSSQCFAYFSSYSNPLYLVLLTAVCTLHLGHCTMYHELIVLQRHDKLTLTPSAVPMDMLKYLFFHYPPAVVSTFTTTAFAGNSEQLNHNDSSVKDVFDNVFNCSLPTKQTNLLLYNPILYFPTERFLNDIYSVLFGYGSLV